MPRAIDWDRTEVALLENGFVLVEVPSPIVCRPPSPPPETCVR